MTWDRYSQYRNRNPDQRDEAVALAAAGVPAGQAALYLDSRYNTRIQPKDYHRIVQSMKEHSRTLSDGGIQDSEIRQLIDAINECGDMYRTKWRSANNMIDCIMYWDPTDVPIARGFCQVLQVDSMFKDNSWRFPLLEVTATTNEMNTFLIAQVLIPSESHERLLWVFEQVFFLTIIGPDLID